MKTKIFLTFFLIVILMFLLSSCYINIMTIGDIPTISYFTIGEEEYVKQQILRCKNVESVEFERRSDYPEDDAYSIYVYLTNNRFISFSDIELYHFKSSRGKWPQTLLQINDLVPIVQYFKPVSLPPTNKPIEYKSSAKGFIEIQYLPELMEDMKLINILELINNIDYLYDYFNSLPDSFEYFEKIPKYTYFYNNYNEKLKVPEELKSNIPFSIIHKEKYYNHTYEEGYKFYKMTVEEAIKKYGYKSLKTGYEKQK